MIVIAFGANLPGRYGRPADTYRAACRALEAKDVHIVRESSLWETSPVGTPDEQPWYVNAVMAVETALSPQALMETLLAVELEMGRVRTFRNAAKTVDLDLIAYQGQIIEKAPNLVVPHPRMHERAFVLKPLAEISKNWVHPVSKISLINLIKELPADQEARIIAQDQAA